MRNNMKPHRFVAPLVAALAFGAVAEAQAQSERLELEQYLDIETVANAEISPDGTSIIYTRSYIDKVNDKFVPGLWIMNADGSRNRQLVDGANVHWSPNGGRIVYTSDTGDEGTEIFVRWMDAEGATSQITHSEHKATNLSWSPNGEWIAFTALIPMKTDWTIQLPARPDGANWTKDPRIIEAQHYRRDRVGWTEGYNHLFVVPADGGTPRQMP